MCHQTAPTRDVLADATLLTLHTDPKHGWDHYGAFLQQAISAIEDTAGPPRVVIVLPDRHIWAPPLNILNQVRQRVGARGGELHVVCDDVHVRDAFTVSGLDKVIRVHASLCCLFAALGD